MPDPSQPRISNNIWNDQTSYGPMHNLGDALADWPMHEEVDPFHFHNIIELGNTLEVRHQHLEREAGRSLVSHEDDPQQPLWSFLNAPLPAGMKDVDDGGSTNVADHHRHQHPLMAVARYSGISALSFVMAKGNMRPCPSSGLNDHRHTFNVADVLGRRGMTGALGVLQRYETDPDALGQQAMLWVGGAVGTLKHEALPEAKPWLDLAAYCRPPFCSAMDKLLSHTFDSEVSGEQATATLDAMLNLAPWEGWRHQNSDEDLVSMTANDWLYEILNNGATWAFDVWKKNHPLPSSSEFDAWRATWTPEDANTHQAWSLAARQRMIVEIEQGLLHQGLAATTGGTIPPPTLVRRRL